MPQNSIVGSSGIHIALDKNSDTRISETVEMEIHTSGALKDVEGAENGVTTSEELTEKEVAKIGEDSRLAEGSKITLVEGETYEFEGGKMKMVGGKVTVELDEAVTDTIKIGAEQTLADRGYADGVTLAKEFVCRSNSNNTRDTIAKDSILAGVSEIWINGQKPSSPINTKEVTIDGYTIRFWGAGDSGGVSIFDNGIFINDIVLATSTSFDNSEFLSKCPLDLQQKIEMAWDFTGSGAAIIRVKDGATVIVSESITKETRGSRWDSNIATEIKVAAGSWLAKDTFFREETTLHIS